MDFFFFSPSLLPLPDCCGTDRAKERKPKPGAGRVLDTHGAFNGALACGRGEHARVCVGSRHEQLDTETSKASDP